MTLLPSSPSPLTLSLIGNPRAKVLAAIEKRAIIGIQSELMVSYMEIYGEKVTNLLEEDKKAVGAWQGTACRAALDGRAGVKVTNTAELEALLRRGDAAKARAATRMNERSSRAHALLLLTLSQTLPATGGPEVKVTSQMVLADLGGCEQLKKSGAVGERKKEAVQINVGLLALKECITALNERRGYVPYQNSKLTMLLSEALGGDSKTAVIVTGSMEAKHSGETMQALRFGEKCASVKNTAQVTTTPTPPTPPTPPIPPTLTQGGISGVAALIAALDKEIAQCEKAIQEKERWERMQHVVPVDEFGDGGGVREYSVLVGAEEERASLETLLGRRRELLGEKIPDLKADAGGSKPAATGLAAKLRAETEGKAAPELAELKKEKEKAEQQQMAPAPVKKGKIPARFAARMAKESGDPGEEKARKLKEKMERAEARKKKLDEEKQAKARAQAEKVKQKQGITNTALRSVTNIRRSIDPSTPLKKPNGWDDEPVRLGGARLPTDTCNSRSGQELAAGTLSKKLQPLQAKVSRWPSPLTVIQKGVPLAAATLGSSPTEP